MVTPSQGLVDDITKSECPVEFSHKPHFASLRHCYQYNGESRDLDRTGCGWSSNIRVLVRESDESAILLRIRFALLGPFIDIFGDT